MPFALSVLGSGSLGNSTLLRLRADGRARCLLIDAGMSPRMTTRRLEPLGVELDEIEGLLLTHLDGDHYHRGWKRVIERNGLPVHVHARHRHAAVRRGVPVAHMETFDEVFEPLAGARVRGLLLSHDQLGTVGYRIEHAGRRLGFATDVGRVHDGLLRHLAGVDLLALESNYDRRMQLRSERPDFLRRRIMGGAGHLSNDQAIDAVLRIDATRPLARVIALHVSRECNDPALIRRLYARRAPHLLERLTISDQHRPTELLDVAGGAARGEQLMLI